MTVLLWVGLAFSVYAMMNRRHIFRGNEWHDPALFATDVSMVVLWIYFLTK